MGEIKPKTFNITSTVAIFENENRRIKTLHFMQKRKNANILQYEPPNEIQNATKPNVYLDFSYYSGENRRLLPDSANGTHIIDGVHAR